MKRAIRPYYRQAGVPYVTSNKGTTDRVECRVSPGPLMAFCKVVRDQAPNWPTAHFLRCLEVWLRDTTGEQWESFVLVARREQVGECFALLYQGGVTRHLRRDDVFELRGAFGAALGGFWQRRYLPGGWDRDHEEFAPAQGELVL